MEVITEKQLNFKISESDLNKLKIKALEKNLTLKEYLNQIIKNELKKE